MLQSKFDLSYEYDEKRQGYWISGSGFDFFAYFTSDEVNTYVEADVTRKGDSLTLHIVLRLGAAGKVHRDIFETALSRELEKYWDC